MTLGYLILKDAEYILDRYFMWLKSNEKSLVSRKINEMEGEFIRTFNVKRVGVWKHKETDDKIVEFKANQRAMELMRMLNYEV
jgi:hypothetical protein